MVKSKYKIDRAVPLNRSLLHPNEWNPNRMGDRTQAAIAESINDYGQVAELLVRPHPEIPGEYQIIDGEHRFNVLAETVYCNVIYDIPDEHAKKLTVIMDGTRGEFEKIELAKLLADINESLGEDTLSALPYEQTELDELIKLSEVDWNSFEDDFKSESGDIPASLGFTTITFKVPTEAMGVLQQAYDLVKDERGLHQDRAIAWGQVIESIAADYLASPH
jgi:hypothetical protein